MNPVKLKFRHGGEMLVSPIGLRFVEDPDHGPLVLIPELSGPRAYQLDMTLEEAEQAFRPDQTELQALRGRVEELTRVVKGFELFFLHRWQALMDELGFTVFPKEAGGVVLESITGRGLRSLQRDTKQHSDRWQALALHLGLPEGWEHLREGAAEVK